MKLVHKIKDFILTSRYAPGLAFAVIVLFFVMPNKYLPSLDGPAHIHNSILLKEYLMGNDAVKANYAINEFYIPNFFSNYYLMVLMTICGTTLGLKVFYFSLLFFLLYAAYYFLRSFNVRWPFLLTLTFVLLFNSFLLNIGFYNFSFSVIFLLFALGFFYRHMIKPVIISTKQYFIYFLLLLLLYYSNGLSFAIYVVYVGALKSANLIKACIDRSKEDRKTILKQLILMALLTLPFIIMFFLFENKARFGTEYRPIDQKEYWLNLIDFTSFIVYVRDAEQPITSLMFKGILIVFFTSVCMRCFRFKFASQDLLLLVAFSALTLYFLIPDNYSVGMMSTRLQYLFYLFLILWLFIQPGKYLKYILAVFIFALSIYKYQTEQHLGIKTLNERAKQVVKASDYIEANKTVVVFNYADNWIEKHFVNYLGIKKPVLVLDNYEALVGWFSLRWAIEKMPTYLIQGRGSFEQFNWNFSEGRKVAEADYIFIYGESRYFEKNNELIELLKGYTRLDHKEYELASVYKRKD